MNTKIEIYYYGDLKLIPENVLTEILFGRATKDMIDNYYVKVYEYSDTIGDINSDIIYEYFEMVFRKFNDENLNPLSYSVSKENQQRVRDLKTHTSMSVGDVIKINTEIYVITIDGPKKVE